MGYNFCGRGGLIYPPDPRTCRFFSCVSTFNYGSGYMVECGTVLAGTYDVYVELPGGAITVGTKRSHFTYTAS